jgi:hypothetical protein
MNYLITSNSKQKIMEKFHSSGYRMCEVYDAYKVAYNITPDLKEIEIIMQDYLDRL